MEKILIVDDEPQIVSSVSDVLESFGFETISSTDPRKVIRWHRRRLRILLSLTG